MKKNLSMCLGVSLLGMLVGCASKVSPVKMASSVNPNEELSTQQKMIEAGYVNQVDILAADDFSEGRDYFSKAKKLNKKGAPSKEVLDTLGYSRAYLEHAYSDADKSTRHLIEITKARQEAISVGARNFPVELKA